MKRKRGNKKDNPKTLPFFTAAPAPPPAEDPVVILDDSASLIEVDLPSEKDNPRVSSEKAELGKKSSVDNSKLIKTSKSPSYEAPPSQSKPNSDNSISIRKDEMVVIEDEKPGTCTSSRAKEKENDSVGGGSGKEDPKTPLPLRRCLYDKRELDSALAIVKKVMNMNVAEPFIAPVNPVALGIPDYFDIIDTPMDLGTIRCNLEKGDKYMNSEDVYKDVQLIWDNCYTYNRKGDYILDLMRRVKKNFMKYWKAAGLYTEPKRGSRGTNGVSREDVVTSNLANTKATKTKKRCYLDVMLPGGRGHMGEESTASDLGGRGPMPQELHTPQGPQALTPAMVSISPAASTSHYPPPAPQTQESGTVASTSAQGTGASSLSVGFNRYRGQYKGVGLEKTNRQTGHKLVVNIELVQGRPLLADQSAKLSSEIGLAARQCIPVSRDWRALSHQEKAPAFSQIQTRLQITGLMEDPVIYRHVDQRMGQIRRRWKHELKMEYEKSGDAAKPEWIQVDDWEAQTKMWCSDKGKAKAKTNQETRKNKVKNIHNCGSRAYVPRLAEMAQQEGVKPDAIQFFYHTHYTAPGGRHSAGWKTPEAEANYNRMLRLRDEAIAQGTPRTADDIVDEVMRANERTDYRPGWGYGPPAVGSSSSQSRVSVALLQDELQASQAREATLVARLETQERATAQVQSECAQVRTDYAQVQSNYAQLQAQLQVQHQMLQQIIAGIQNFSASQGSASHRG